MKAFFIGGLLFCSVFLVDCSNPDRPYAKLEPSQTRKIRVHFQTAPNTCGPAALIGAQHIAITDPIWDSTVIEPYSAHTAGDKDKPAVYTRNSTPTVKGKVWCENNLSQSTPIHLDTLGPHSMDFDADGGSIQNGISAYFTLPSSNGGNDQFKNFVYKYGPGVGHETPSNSKYLLQWKYRIDGDDVWMDTMNDTDHVVYLTLSTPTGFEYGNSHITSGLRPRIKSEIQVLVVLSQVPGRTMRIMCTMTTQDAQAGAINYRLILPSPPEHGITGTNPVKVSALRHLRIVIMAIRLQSPGEAQIEIHNGKHYHCFLPI